MSRVRGKGTSPETAVCSMVHRLGYRFRKNISSLPGKPDIVLKKHKKIIFVHGCFWHSHKDYKRSSRPTTNTEFWYKKLDANMVRDENHLQILQYHGWRVLIVWQCELRDPDTILDKLKNFLES
jgi:DNA mismatch endonuclease (patch repair protein)